MARKNLRSVLGAVGVVALLLSGCGSSDSDARSAAPEESATSSTLLGGTKGTFISLDNQLTLPDGTPATVTWRVSDTTNEVWDGESRPDHAPPKGLQGLVQPSKSGPYTARAEVNTSSSYNPFFTLTPTITVDGQETALTPWDMLYTNGWNFTTDRPQTNQTKVYGCRGSHKTGQFTAATPQGDLTYTVAATCTSDTYTFTIQAP